MFDNKCKSCGKSLPHNYSYKECEACRNKKIDKIKKGASIGGSILSICAIVVGLIFKKK